MVDILVHCNRVAPLKYLVEELGLHINYFAVNPYDCMQSLELIEYLESTGFRWKDIDCAGDMNYY